MSKADDTRARLLDAARAAFWQRGYASVGLRDIAAVAGVDVALVSRYFGGKRGLFAATLDRAFDWPELLAGDPVAVVVAKYADPKTGVQDVSVMRMILMNAGDPDVGELVRDGLEMRVMAPLRARMGGDAAAPNVAMFLAVVLGATMARGDLGLRGMADAPPAIFAAELRHLIAAALDFRSGDRDRCDSLAADDTALPDN